MTKWLRRNEFTIRRAALNRNRIRLSCSWWAKSEQTTARERERERERNANKKQIEQKTLHKYNNEFDCVVIVFFWDNKQFSEWQQQSQFNVSVMLESKMIKPNWNEKRSAIKRIVASHFYQYLLCTLPAWQIIHQIEIINHFTHTNTAEVQRFAIQSKLKVNVITSHNKCENEAI